MSVNFEIKHDAIYSNMLVKSKSPGYVSCETADALWKTMLPAARFPWLEVNHNFLITMAITMVRLLPPDPIVLPEKKFILPN